MVLSVDGIQSAQEGATQQLRSEEVSLGELVEDDLKIVLSWQYSSGFGSATISTLMSCLACMAIIIELMYVSTRVT